MQTQILQNPRGHFLAQLLKARLRACFVKLCDDIRDGIADARDFGKDPAAMMRQDCLPFAKNRLSPGTDCRRAAKFCAYSLKKFTRVLESAFAMPEREVPRGTSDWPGPTPRSGFGSKFAESPIACGNTSKTGQTIRKCGGELIYRYRTSDRKEFEDLRFSVRSAQRPTRKPSHRKNVSVRARHSAEKATE